MLHKFKGKEIKDMLHSGETHWQITIEVGTFIGVVSKIRQQISDLPVKNPNPSKADPELSLRAGAGEGYKKRQIPKCSRNTPQPSRH